MNKSPEISVVIPAYHEEENLKLILPRIHASLEPLNVQYEIVIVDTVQPMDHTELTCTQNQARHVRRQPGNTFGDAVRTGIEEARGKYLIFMDADGSHAPEYIPELMVHRFDQDIVAASRYIDGGFTENSWTLVAMSRVLNFSYALILNLKLKDVSNSFKLYRGDLLRKLVLKCDNFDIIQEILFKIFRACPDVRVKEVPFSFKKRMFGETKRNLFLFILTYLFTMIRLRMSVMVPFLRSRRSSANQPNRKTSTPLRSSSSLKLPTQ